MMNDHSIYDYILQDDIYMGVIGMLECASSAHSLFHPPSLK